MAHVMEETTMTRIVMACLVGSVGLLAACGAGSGPTGGTGGTAGAGGAGGIAGVRGVGGMAETITPVVYQIRSVDRFGVPLDAAMPAERISQPLIATLESLTRGLGQRSI